MAAPPWPTSTVFRILESLPQRPGPSGGRHGLARAGPELATITYMLEGQETAADRLTLDIERQDGVAIVRCGGKLVLGVTGFLYDNVRKLMPEYKRIVLDLTDLKDMDSMGIGTLVRLYVSAKSAGSTLELINLGKRIRDLLGVTHLLSVFAVCGEQGVRLP